MSNVRRVLITTAVGALFALGAATTALAHVTVSADNLSAGSYAFLDVRVPHGCEEKPTAVLRVQIPENVLTVTPGRNPGWEVEKVMTELDEPVEGPHGEQITERVSEVVWTADEPLASDQVDVFHLSVRWPDDAADTSVAFPAIQECPGGAESAWTEPVIEGEDEPEMPAPTLMLTEAAGDGHGGGGDDADEADADDADDSESIAWAGVGLGGLALVLAAAGFLRSGRRS